MPVDKARTGPGRPLPLLQTFAGLLVLAPGLGAVPCQGSVLTLQLLDVLGMSLGKRCGGQCGDANFLDR